MSEEIINIKVVQKTINDEKKRFVNAGELYQWLKSKRQFADWIKDRIEKYDFVENLDYFITVANFGDGVRKRTDGILVDKKTGKVIFRDYVLTIDMAKEIAMLENFPRMDVLELINVWKCLEVGLPNITATYDEELRNIKHPKLIDYKKEFTEEL